MNDVLKDAYDKCGVGHTCFARYDPPQPLAVVKLAAEALSSKGLIHIKLIHQDSQSGNHLVDMVQFVKLK